jgi:hypothetical protein
MEGELLVPFPFVFDGKSRRKGKRARTLTFGVILWLCVVCRHLAMATRHGSISTLNFQSSQLQSEIHVNETCRDITSVFPYYPASSR